MGGDHEFNGRMETARQTHDSNGVRIMMADNTTDYLSSVNDVIAICKDAEEGFKGAANAADDPALKTSFEQYSAQRAAFASELSDVVTSLGLTPKSSSGVLGTLHHGWIALKGTLTGHSEHQILEETERGEDLSMSRYRDALQHDLPAQLRSVLQTQFEQVQLAHSRIRFLRDATSRRGKATA
jgi:uncharacterized protein (TIGR02284 family)